jgi:hypothetical protein
LKLVQALGADEVIDINRYPTVAERVGIVRELTDGLST